MKHPITIRLCCWFLERWKHDTTRHTVATPSLSLYKNFPHIGDSMRGSLGGNAVWEEQCATFRSYCMKNKVGNQEFKTVRFKRKKYHIQVVQWLLNDCILLLKWYNNTKIINKWHLYLAYFHLWLHVTPNIQCILRNCNLLFSKKLYF